MFGSFLGFTIHRLIPKWAVWLLARRFIAGRDIMSALGTAKRQNKDGFRVSVNYIAEELSDCNDIQRIKLEYALLLGGMAKLKISGDISVKLSQFGMLQEKVPHPVLNFGHSALEAVVSRASKIGIRVWIDAERLAWREETWYWARRLAEKYSNVGIRIQAYAKDAPEFFAKELHNGWFWPVGVCKGAYREKHSLVVAGEELRMNFIYLCRFAADLGVPLQIDTHDEELSLEAELAIAGAEHEHGLLCGVAPQFAETLRDTGEKVNIYAPYGGDYKPYVARRIAERASYIFLPLRRT